MSAINVEQRQERQERPALAIDIRSLGKEPTQVICPMCHTSIITEVRRRLHCGLFRCSFLHYHHYCPICDTRIKARLVSRFIK
ncbi:hypothetical protein AB6A40_001835 [Gnathostoma spinigerum]|uniref:LITAF domain-containing protein n=1 Tax=Gnathostoma spinigerum TaxID=75299 RepID=A0ABD6E6D7_9BILA